MMNEHPEQRYIYITPFLLEAQRIIIGCPELRFREPQERPTKMLHLKDLLMHGENIASTHQLFSGYDHDIIELVREHEYVLIIDEAVETFMQDEIKRSDLNMIKTANWIVSGVDGMMEVIPNGYTSGRFEDIVRKARNHNMVVLDDMNDLYYWVMNAEAFGAFKDIYVLTYMFSCQTLKYYFDINEMPYQYIGIEHPAEQVFRFTDGPGYIPDYVTSLPEKIHIFDNAKMNMVGGGQYALSVNWMKRAEAENGGVLQRQLKNNIYNFFTNYNGQSEPGQRMWSTYKDFRTNYKGRGYSNGFVQWNQKATNMYSGSNVLAYCVNIFCNPHIKSYFNKFGITVSDDEYALSAMVQWIWRSAIRNGKEISVYLPSERTRNLLIGWIDKTANKNADIIGK